MRNDIGRYFAFSFFVHLSVLALCIVSFSKPAYIYLPVQLQFYSQSNGEAKAAAALAHKKVPRTVRAKAPEKRREAVKVSTKKEIVYKPAKPAEKETERIEEKPQKPAQSAGATAQPVMGGSNISLDAKNFPYAYYTNTVVKKIGQNWSWGEKFGRLKSLVYFRIQRNGSVTGLTVKNSSGDDLFDQQAMRSVELASPFPPLPSEYKEDSLGVYFEFTYTE